MDHANAVSYAGFWKRFAAYIVDTLVILVPLFIIGVMIGLGMIADLETEEEIATATAGLESVINLISLLIGWVYFAAMESTPKQGTLGKMALGIKVTDLAGQRISFGRASGRFFGKIVSGLILGIGFLMIAFTARKQGLHDLMAGTLVVNR